MDGYSLDPTLQLALNSSKSGTIDPSHPQIILVPGPYE
jgi:hypothetical protein